MWRVLGEELRQEVGALGSSLGPFSTGGSAVAGLVPPEEREALPSGPVRGRPDLGRLNPPPHRGYIRPLSGLPPTTSPQSVEAGESTGCETLLSTFG